MNQTNGSTRCKLLKEYHATFNNLTYDHDNSILGHLTSLEPLPNIYCSSDRRDFEEKK